jgi:glycosyltransferase involved in cell wall biosynthesis
MKSNRNALSFIGRCEYRKGIDRVFEIISKLESEIKINIVGNWDVSDIALKTRFENLKNVDVISFINQNEIARIMGESRIFLFPSRAEGAARVVSEALHAGCVVFSTFESGIPIPDNVGFTINNMSDDAIRENIMRVMNNDLELEKNAFASRSYIEELESSYMSTLLSIYNEIQKL